MDLEELKIAFRDAGIHLVPVEFLDYGEDDGQLRVKGSLQDYLAALNALHIMVAFVYVESLDASDFLYSPGEDEGETSEEYDLCSVIPRISGFKKQIGHVGRFVLYAPMQGEGLGYLIDNDWYDEFLKLREEGIDSIERDLAGKASELEIQDRARVAGLRRQMDDLLEDKKFTRLPTQKAMLAYAKLKIPGVDGLDDGTLRTTISDLAARIAARGGE